MAKGTGWVMFTHFGAKWVKGAARAVILRESIRDYQDLSVSHVSGTFPSGTTL